MKDALLRDVRYALRHLRRAPGFSLVAILTLALGIGANTALFSVLNAIVLRRLPVREPERLVAVSLADAKGQQQRLMYFSTFLELRRHQGVFETMFAYSGGGLFTTEANGVLSMAGLEGMTPEYYTVLGVRPLVGRVISEDDAPPTGEPARVVVLGYRFWQRQFGGDPGVVGQPLPVDGTPLTIMGVLPPEFRGLQVDAGSDIFVPLTLIRRLGGSASDPLRPVRAYYAIGRLRQGVTLAQARAEIRTLWPSVQAATMPPGLSAAEQGDLRSQQVRIESVATGFSSLRVRYATPLSLLIGLTVLLLLIACVNLSGLLLARAVARGPHLAICLALGATRTQLARQLMVESLLLAGAGTAVALPVAWWATRTFAAVLWLGTMSLTMSMTPDGRVFGLTTAVAIGTGLIVGALPAWAATRNRAHVGLQPAHTVARATGRWGKTLLVVQVALSLVLLFGAGLFARSLANLRNLDSGFRPEGILWTRLTAQPGGYRDIDDAAYYPELVRQLSMLPRVESVALSHFFPAYFDYPLSGQPVARTDSPDPTTEVSAPMEVVSPRFFHTIGARLMRGRDFTWHDDARSPAVAIVNETLSRRLFPSGNVIGQRIRVGVEPRRRTIEIVGVVTDLTVGNLRAPHRPVVFRPWLQESQFTKVPVVNLRASSELVALGDSLRRTVASLGHEYIRNLYTLDEQVDRSLLQERLMSALSSFFAGLAVLMASIGLYGLLAYAVTRRTREIGVRMALGATRATVLRMVVWEGLALTMVGVAIGIPCALGVGRLTGALLFGVAASDALTLIGAAGLFIIIGAIASLRPAHWASSIDPIAALRCE